MPEPKKTVKRSPLVTKLVPNAKEASSPLLLVGWIGDGAEPDTCRLYLDLQLTCYFDISENDVLHVEEITPTDRNFGAAYLWIKRDALLKLKRTNTNEKEPTMSDAAAYLRGQIQQNYLQPGAGGGGFSLPNLCPAVGGVPTPATLCTQQPVCVPWAPIATAYCPPVGGVPTPATVCTQVAPCGLPHTHVGATNCPPATVCAQPTTFCGGVGAAIGTAWACPPPQTSDCFTSLCQVPEPLAGAAALAPSRIIYMTGCVNLPPHPTQQACPTWACAQPTTPYGGLGAAIGTAWACPPPTGWNCATNFCEVPATVAGGAAPLPPTHNFVMTVCMNQGPVHPTHVCPTWQPLCTLAVPPAGGPQVSAVPHCPTVPPMCPGQGLISAPPHCPTVPPMCAPTQWQCPPPLSAPPHCPTVPPVCAPTHWQCPPVSAPPHCPTVPPMCAPTQWQCPTNPPQCHPLSAPPHCPTVNPGCPGQANVSVATQCPTVAPLCPVTQWQCPPLSAPPHCPTVAPMCAPPTQWQCPTQVPQCHLGATPLCHLTQYLWACPTHQPMQGCVAPTAAPVC